MNIITNHSSQRVLRRSLDFFSTAAEINKHMINQYEYINFFKYNQLEWKN